VEREESGRRCSDTLEVEDEGRRSGGHGGECRDEAVVVDYATIMNTLLQVEGDCSERRQQPNERKHEDKRRRKVVGLFEVLQPTPTYSVDRMSGYKPGYKPFRMGIGVS
jgi:hypothetical protein